MSDEVAKDEPAKDEPAKDEPAKATAEASEKSSASERTDKPAESPPRGAWGKLKAWVKRIRERWDEHVREYGAIAIIVYLAIWLTVWAGFAVAISMGVDVGGDVSGAGMAGIIGAAYIPTKVSQPIRIAATLVVTPIVANLWHRIRGRDPKVRIGRAAMAKHPKSDDDDDDDDDGDDDDDAGGEDEPEPGAAVSGSRG